MNQTRTVARAIGALAADALLIGAPGAPPTASAPLPESSAWALMLIGIGGIGAVTRRRPATA